MLAYIISQLFSLEDWSEFCLAHLFTYQDFAGGTIGLAYVASQRRDTVGGICSRRKSMEFLQN